MCGALKNLLLTQCMASKIPQNFDEIITVLKIAKFA